MKNLLSFLIISLVLVPSAFSGSYLLSGTVAREDRIGADSDGDINDEVFQYKAIFEQSAGEPSIGEILIMITPVAYGATDHLELWFDGSSVDAGAQIFLHKEDQILEAGSPLLPLDGSGNFKIFSGPSDRFKNCAKNKLINTLQDDCEGIPVVLTIFNSGLSFLSGSGVIRDGAQSHSAGVTNLVDNSLAFGGLTFTRNVTMGHDIDETNGTQVEYPGTEIVKERVHWYDATFQRTPMYKGSQMETLYQ